MDSKLGQFFASGSSAANGFFIIWPFEVMKNLAQAETKGVGSSNMDRARFVMKTYGPTGFYRGFVPGAGSVFIRNGAAMIVMAKAQ